MWRRKRQSPVFNLRFREALTNTQSVLCSFWKEDCVLFRVGWKAARVIRYIAVHKLYLSSVGNCLGAELWKKSRDHVRSYCHGPHYIEGVKVSTAVQMEMHSEGGANRTQTVNTQGIEGEGKKHQDQFLERAMWFAELKMRGASDPGLFPVDLLNPRSTCILSYASVFIGEINVEVWASWSHKNSG